MSIQSTIEAKLREELQPLYLEVVNESPMHNVPAGSETHFKVIVASPAFEGLPRVTRHRRVYAILADELGTEVHALSISAISGTEWAAGRGSLTPTPDCRGGSKLDKM